MTDKWLFWSSVCYLLPTLTLSISPLPIAASSSFLKGLFSIPLALVGLFITVPFSLPYLRKGRLVKVLSFYMQMGWEKFQIFWELLNWEDISLKLFAIRFHSTFHLSTKGVSLFIGVKYLLKKWIQVGFFPKNLNCLHLHSLYMSMQQEGLEIEESKALLTIFVFVLTKKVSSRSITSQQQGRV